MPVELDGGVLKAIPKHLFVSVLDIESISAPVGLCM